MNIAVSRRSKQIITILCKPVTLHARSRLDSYTFLFADSIGMLFSFTFGYVRFVVSASGAGDPVSVRACLRAKYRNTFKTTSDDRTPLRDRRVSTSVPPNTRANMYFRFSSTLWIGDRPWAV